MFVPLYDSNPLRYIHFQYVTFGLIALNVVSFLLVGDLLNDRPETLGAIFSYALFSEAIGGDPGVFIQGNLPFEPLRLFTYAFLHGDFWHLASNMLFLWVFGDNVEDHLGHLKFLLFYLASGVAAGLAHMALALDAQAPLVGASGAVSGVMAAYLVLHPDVRVWVLFLGRIPLRLPAFWLILGWGALQLYFLVFDTGSGVSYAAHLGGLLAGLGLLPFVRRRSG